MSLLHFKQPESSRNWRNKGERRVLNLKFWLPCCIFVLY